MAAGLRRVEITSFVSPRWVPQLGDAEELARTMKPPAGVTFSALCPNARGLERAMETGLTRLGELQATQVAQQAEMVRGLHHLLATLEFKDRDVVSLLREQSVALSGIGRDLTVIVDRPDDAPFTDHAVERLGAAFAASMAITQDTLLQRLSAGGSAGGSSGQPPEAGT